MRPSIRQVAFLNQLLRVVAKTHHAVLKVMLLRAFLRTRPLQTGLHKMPFAQKLRLTGV
jgi:hypothetical protein